MSYAALMVHVHAEGELSGRVKLAAELADRFRALLVGIAAWAPTSLFASKQPVVDETQPHLQDMMSLLEVKGREFHAAVAGEGRRVEWRSILDVPTEAVAREARAADLVVVGNRRESANPMLALDPGSLLLKVGRPVLVVPPALSSLAPKRVAVAWKDVREARRAVLDALPFLRQADSVMVVEVSEADEEEQALHRVRDVTAYLARHGVEVVTERVRPDEVGAANSLLRLIHDESIDLIVAGGYGHSRLGEWAYGGATRGLLTESPICCLLSH
jgi:nucleotide-binding universal stress UspA family protein